MVDPAYVPERGDVVWMTFDPTLGHEQAGRRPACVLSPGFYNRASPLILVCPVTSQVKGYPFEVDLPGGLAVTGAVLCDHVRSVDWRPREIELMTTLPADVTAQILATVRRLLD